MCFFGWSGVSPMITYSSIRLPVIVVTVQAPRARAPPKCRSPKRGPGGTPGPRRVPTPLTVLSRTLSSTPQLRESAKTWTLIETTPEEAPQTTSAQVPSITRMISARSKGSIITDEAMIVPAPLSRPGLPAQSPPPGSQTTARTPQAAFLRVYFVRYELDAFENWPLPDGTIHRLYSFGQDWRRLMGMYH